MPRRWGTYSVAVAAVAVVLAGCTTDGAGQPDSSASPTSAPSVTTSVDAVQALAEGARKLSETSFKVDFTVASVGKVSGAFDMPRKTGEIQMTFENRQVAVRILDKDLYIKGTPTVPSDKWMHVDLARLPGSHPFASAVDPLAVTRFMDGVTDVRETSKGRFQGTIDLKQLVNKVPPERRQEIQQLINMLGDRDATLPFEAALDDQGRLTQMKLTIPVSVGGKPQDIVLQSDYRDFGTPVDIARPSASETVEAPPALYRVVPS